MRIGQREIRLVSKRLLFSYILDWIVIIAAAAVGAVFSIIAPNRRPFSLSNPDISFPHVEKEKVSPALLVILALICPAIVILIVCLFFVPGPTVDKNTSKALIWRRKLWELNTGWLGLALGLASTFLITSGMKNMYGKPRPDLLSRCDPDMRNITAHEVGFGSTVNDTALLVSWTICQASGATLEDGFRSFPSGHASSSWAGMTYLTLFLCAKFAIAIPFLAPRTFNRETVTPAFPHFRHNRPDTSSDMSAKQYSGASPTSYEQERFHGIPIRNQAAAPPTYLLVLALVPIGAAIYISSSRFSDFRHFGFDIIFGGLMGFSLAWFSFRWYHLPIRQGAGWSWGSRSRDRAFGVGVGVMGYVGEEGWSSSGEEPASNGNGADIELGETGATSAFMGGGAADTVSIDRQREAPSSSQLAASETAYDPRR
ncbi:MAG: hypothetical protein M1825_003549 [Sarcosagium campestre]|nr:MAG: hypothetical protein M1825_003549 [Sarcosagium campestre]